MNREEALKCLKNDRKPSKDELVIAKKVIRYLLALSVMEEGYELPNIYHLKIVEEALKLKI